jgi:predicted transposase YdaD
MVEDPPPGALIRELTQKSNKRLMVGTIEGRQKGKAKERPKDAQPIGTQIKKGKS